MELYQLRTFATVADESHLTRASERLHLSQPAVSGHIKALETQLGVRLFERASSGMVLTDAGRELLTHAQRVLAAAEEVKQAALRLNGDVSGSLRVGTVADPESNRLGDLLSNAVARHPRLKIELHQMMTGAALADVLSGELDASFYFGDLPADDIFTLPLRSFVYVVTAPAAWSDRVVDADWNALTALPWVRTPDASSHTQLVTRLFAGRQLAAPTASIQADDESVLTNLIVSGLGLALVREDLAQQLAAAGEVVIRPDTRIETTLWFVCQAKRKDEPLLAALLDVVRETWSGEVTPIEEPALAAA
jgi:DNA-binding transcriptional LysR family regulator